MDVDYTQMSDQELEEAIQAASAEREAVKARARALTAELDRRAAVKFVESMSDEQKAQILGAIGIESKEGVNGG